MVPLMKFRSVSAFRGLHISAALSLALACPVFAAELTGPSIDSIAVRGNLPCSERDLLSGSGLKEGASLYLVSRGEALRTVTSNLTSRGYLEAAVDIEWPGWNADTSVISVTVDAGRQSLRGALIFQGVRLFNPLELAGLYPQEVGGILAPSDTLDFVNSITRLYGQRGYVRAVAEIHLMPFDEPGPDSIPSTRGIECIVDEGEQVFLGTITVQGLNRVREKVVLREIALQPGDSLNLEILRQSITNIYSLGLFYDVRFSYPGLDSGAGTVDLNIRVTESRFRTLDLAAGYLSPSAVFGSATWRHPNIMGNNQILTLSASYTRFLGDNHGVEFKPKLSYEEPYFLSTRWRGRLTLSYLYLEQPALGERRYTGELSFARDLSRDWRLTAGYTLGRSKFWEETDAGYLYHDWTTLSSFSGELVNDTRSPIFNPVAGRRLTGSIAISGGILGGLDYYSVEAGGRTYLSLGSGFVLAGRIEGGRVTTYGETESVPPEDRFFLGGGTTIRGYGHNAMGPKNSDGNPLGGNVMLLGSIEARISLVGALGAVLFLDTGGLWSTADDISLSTAGMGTGMGLRYDTPFGPFRIDYGFAPTWADGFRRGKVYIAIGQAF
jgi:outer membrane protein assembly factor BamA